MTEADIKHIEATLGITLPDDYRRVLTQYPFSSDSWADLAMPAEVDRLMEINQYNDYLTDYGIATPGHYFCIGGDGGEIRYYIDVTRTQSPIFAVDLEQSAMTEAAPNVDAWISQIRATDDEIARDQQDMARKRWWQFWK